jgi:hypothetical protein
MAEHNAEQMAKHNAKEATEHHANVTCPKCGKTHDYVRWLQRAYDERAAQMIGLKWDFDSLRSDPRFQDLVRRVGVPPPQA